ncbi:MAG: hypothetical protein IJ438_10145 [Clostridia bacterium]|nr:hypothetical protein [Clostridia bacterium]
MTTRIIDSHAPALTPQEAALLPALTERIVEPIPRNLLIRRDPSTFRPVESNAQAAQRFPFLLRASGISLPGMTRMRI